MTFHPFNHWAQLLFGCPHQLGHQSWHKGTRDPGLCLWPTTQSWCLPSTQQPGFKKLEIIKPFSITSEALQYQVLCSCYLFAIGMSTMVSPLWWGSTLTFTGKFDNLQSCAILILHCSPPREQINNPAEEETVLQLYQPSVGWRSSHHSAADLGVA